MRAGRITARKHFKRRAGLLAVASLVVGSLTVSTANATLSAVGPIDPNTGFPTYYQDSTGLRLQQCLDTTGICGALVIPDPASPVSFPGNFPAESFYWAADAQLDNTTGLTGNARVKLVERLQGVFVNATASVNPGDQAVFGRIRIVGTALQAGGTFTFTFPWGTRTLKADSKGGLKLTEDVGCVAAPCGADFTPPLSGTIGPFLRWNSDAPAPPAGYIGDPTVLHRITGSPTGANFFKMTGGNVGATGVSTDLFAVTGKIAPPATPANATLTPAAGLTFPDQVVGTTGAAQAATLTNSGGTALNISTIAVSAGYTRAAGGTCPTTLPGTLAGGASCTINVAFSPTAAGATPGTLTVTDDSVAPTTQSISLGGNGLAKPDATLTPPLAFGNQSTTAPSAPQTATLKNTGGSPLTINGIAIGGTDPSQFSKTTTCGATLGAGLSCTIDVTFAPTTAGAKNATLTVSDNASSGIAQSINLSGTGVAPPTPPNAGLAPATLDYGTLTTGTTSALTATLTNSGGTALNVASIAVTTGTPYSITGGTCPTGPSTVAANGGSCTIIVTFAPTAAGASFPSTLTVTDNSGGGANVTQTTGLTGAANAPTPGPAVAALSPATLDFGSQNINTTSAAHLFTIANTGATDMVVSTVTTTGPFARNGGGTCSATSPFTVAANTSCTVSVTFTPTAATAASGTLSVSHNASNVSPQTATLSGTGTNPVVLAPVASVPLTTVTFAPRTVATTSAAQSVVMTNTGNATLNMTATTLTGANPGDYAVVGSSIVGTPTCGTTLAAGASCAVGVTFKPTTTGTRNALLHFSNDSNNVPGSTQDVPLTGTGNPAPVLTPGISVNPTSFVFPTQSQILGSASSKTFTVTSSGTAPLAISSLSITGFQAGEFTITGQNCAGAILNPGVTCSITVSWRTGGTGTRSAQINITNNATATPKVVPMSGTGKLL